jgi:hypothetical protein
MNITKRVDNADELYIARGTQSKQVETDHLLRCPIDLPTHHNPDFQLIHFFFTKISEKNFTRGLLLNCTRHCLHESVQYRPREIIEGR